MLPLEGIVSRGQHVRDQLLFTNVALAYMLNLNPGFGAYFMRPITNPVRNTSANFGESKIQILCW
ncbi:hypothetical protein [Propionivibrio sp.]|uniref:hypothetical protein n=1 Tax=Propionivibrio sp. TaxID=2212460 RepID=UPI0025E39A73|nr:hypothetical protein [Propionivibrio sp.]